MLAFVFGAVVFVIPDLIGVLIGYWIGSSIVDSRRSREVSDSKDAVHTCFDTVARASQATSRAFSRVFDALSVIVVLFLIGVVVFCGFDTLIGKASKALSTVTIFDSEIKHNQNACDQGDAQACLALADRLSDKDVFSLKVPQAYEKACLLGNVTGCRLAAYSYQTACLRGNTNVKLKVKAMAEKGCYELHDNLACKDLPYYQGAKCGF